ncbi:hypothetical protein YC2023_004912 [Brassica napus]
MGMKKKHKKLYIIKQDVGWGGTGGVILGLGRLSLATYEVQKETDAYTLTRCYNLFQFLYSCMICIGGAISLMSTSRETQTKLTIFRKKHTHCSHMMYMYIIGVLVNVQLTKILQLDDWILCRIIQGHKKF